MIDEAAETRDSERLDEAALEIYLRMRIPGFDGPVSVRQFRKGHSNLTYLVSDGRREWVLRRPPFGTHVATAHDMGREYRILSGLYRAYPLAPRAEFYCEDPSIIGAPFYVMQRVRGVVLRDRPPKGFPWNERFGARLSESFVDNFARVHAVDLEEAGIADLGRPDGYVERQISGWTQRYEKSRTDDVREVEAVAEWLAEKQPPSGPGALIHNDYKYDNIVLDPDDPARIVGVLDWEMATVGDPLMDLGTTLGYWVTSDDHEELRQLPFGVVAFPGTLSRERLVGRYEALTERDCSAVDFFHVYGLFKIAIVAQQIYYRFATGKTDDRRFEVMILGVRLLSRFAARVVDRSPL